MWIIKIIKIKCFYPPRILDEHWCFYSCLQIPPRENLFQYVRRVYTTAINFPCITSLIAHIFYFNRENFSSLYSLKNNNNKNLRIYKHFSWIFKILRKSKVLETTFCNSYHSSTFPGVMRGSTLNFGPIDLAVLTLIGYKRTDRQAKYI